MQAVPLAMVRQGPVPPRAVCISATRCAPASCRPNRSAPSIFNSSVHHAAVRSSNARGRAFSSPSSLRGQWSAPKNGVAENAMPVAPRASSSEEASTTELVGEDAAVFSFKDQNLGDWVKFGGVLAVVLAILYEVWLVPGTGLADRYVELWESTALYNPETTIVLLLGFFAVFHSGLAYLRPYGEEAIGARGFRVLFASVSLLLAVPALFYFINHRYDGTELWNIRSVPGVHALCWILNYVSFLFLYPSTFNLLEIAAVEKPQFHMWETGVMRITRHPQATGQAIWCLGHLLWIGNSMMLTTSVALMAHHVFACWHGDFRLKRKYGDAFEEVKARTSVLPFAAIIDGRQQLPDDYLQEWLRGPYAVVTVGTIGAYFAHPLMQQAAYFFDW